MISKLTLNIGIKILEIEMEKCLMLRNFLYPKFLLADVMFDTQNSWGVYYVPMS